MHREKAPGDRPTSRWSEERLYRYFPFSFLLKNILDRKEVQKKK